MGEWQFMDPASRNNLVAAWNREAEQMLEMASAPDIWERPTRSTTWEVRDVIGHLVDTTEGYFESFDVARGGRTAGAASPCARWPSTSTKERSPSALHRKATCSPGSVTTSTR